MAFPRKILYALIGIILVLLVFNSLTFFNYEYDTYFFKKFNFDKEKNVPSIFSFILLLSSSAMLLYISFKELHFYVSKLFWRSLSFVFLFLSFDELLRIHEKVGTFTSRYIEGKGVFNYEWLIPYGVLLIFLAFIYIKSLFKLPFKVRLQLIFSGVLFLAGAVGIEMITGVVIQNNTLMPSFNLKNSPIIFLLYTIEETLEMLGVSYFIYTLLLIIQSYTTSKPSSFL